MFEDKNCPICNSNNFEIFLYSRDYFFTGEHFNIYYCTHCGYRFTHPVPDLNTIGKYYKTEKYVSHSDTKKGLFFKAYQFIKKINLRNKFNLINLYKKEGKILDYGCGTGDFLSTFKKVNWNVYGIEPDDDTRTYASTKNNINISTPGNINTFENQYFDVITLWHVLEHIPDLNEKLAAIKRVLNTSGILVIAVPNSDSFDAKHYGKYWAAYDLPRHLHHFTPDTLSLLLEKHGFEIIQKKNMLFDSFYVSLLSEKYLKNTFPFFKAIFWASISNLKILKKNTYASSVIFVCQQKRHF